jgi:twitching motility protein PilT
MKHLDILELMDAANQVGASDVHLAPGRHPAFRIDGVMALQDEYPVVAPDESERLLYSILRDDQRLKLDQEWEIDLSYALDLQGHNVRFRINMHRQYRGLAAVFRLIPDKILTPEQIGLEPAIRSLTELPRGLVLVTGPTGSGKSTTLATMIDMINHRERLHILTIEDPIEFVHPEQGCVVTQRELGAHTQSFASALRSALREDPDVILVGEMRDLETIGLALTAAETGHLVFATLHTTDASQTVDRIIDVFPASQQAMVRTQLGSVLQAVVCQVLLPRSDRKGRVAGREIMLATPAVSTLIRENQTQKLFATMSVSIAQGMCPLELSLSQKVEQGQISMDSALSASNRISALTGYLEGKTIPEQPRATSRKPPDPAEDNVVNEDKNATPKKRRSMWGR